MKESEALEFEKATSAYTFGFHQNVIQYHKLLEMKGYTLDDTRDFIFAKRKLIDKEAERLKHLERRCPGPGCDGLMLLLPVNDAPETQTGDPKDKSAWLCQNNRCMETIYNSETIEEIVKSGGT